MAAILSAIFGIVIDGNPSSNEFKISVNPLPDNKNLDWSKLKLSADDYFKFHANSRKFSKQVENIVDKGEIAH